MTSVQVYATEHALFSTLQYLMPPDLSVYIASLYSLSNFGYFNFISISIYIATRSKHFVSIKINFRISILYLSVCYYLIQDRTPGWWPRRCCTRRVYRTRPRGYRSNRADTPQAKQIENKQYRIVNSNPNQIFGYGVNKQDSGGRVVR